MSSRDSLTYNTQDKSVTFSDAVGVKHTIQLGPNPVKSLEAAARNERIKKIVARLLIGAAVLTTLVLLGGVIAHSMSPKLGLPIKLPISLGVGIGVDAVVIGNGLAFSAAFSTAETAMRKAIREFDESELQEPSDPSI